MQAEGGSVRATLLLGGLRFCPLLPLGWSRSLENQLIFRQGP